MSTPESPAKKVSAAALIQPERAVELLHGIRMDVFKLVFDLMKHYTTLSAGALLLLVNLLPKITGPGRFAVAIGFLMLVVSMLCALAAMCGVIMGISGGQGETKVDEESQGTQKSQTADTKKNVWVWICLVISVMVFFAAGLICVTFSAIFFNAN